MCERRGWSEAEDKFIAEKVKLNEKLPEKDRLKWGDIADELNKLYPGVNRSGKQCRQRWHNQLDPSISHNEWTQEEQRKLFQLQRQYGNKWAMISSKLKGRTDNNVKNYFYSTLRKSLRKLNHFISSHRGQSITTAKQFKESSLSKLLAVADHKFDKKINVKKSSAIQQAIDIKNLLIEIIYTDDEDLKGRQLYLELVKKLQEFNKCCKKKKGKKKEESEEEMSGIEELEEEDEQEEKMDEEEEEKSNKRGRRAADNNSNIRSSQNIIVNGNRKIERKQSAQNKKQKKITKAKHQKPQIVEQKKSKPHQNLFPSLTVPQLSKKASSIKQTNSILEQNYAFLQMSRSSLDLGPHHKKTSNNSSQLFKSFNFNESFQEPESQQNQSRSLRKNSFFNKIREEPLQIELHKKGSNFSGVSDILRDQDDQVKDLPAMSSFFKKESSKRELPPPAFDMKKESLFLFSGLSGLRSGKEWSSGGFDNEYNFGGEDNSHK